MIAIGGRGRVGPTRITCQFGAFLFGARQFDAFPILARSKFGAFQFGAFHFAVFPICVPFLRIFPLCVVHHLFINLVNVSSRLP